MAATAMVTGPGMGIKAVFFFQTAMQASVRFRALKAT
jgi:hypothetical protein